jgi:hypothetical protein
MAFFDSSIGKIVLGLFELGNVPSSESVYKTDSDILSVQITDSSSLSISINPTARITQLYDGALVSQTSNARITQLYDGALVSQPSNAKITQLYDGALVSQPSNARITQLYDGALVSEPSNARITQLYVSTLVCVNKFHLFDNLQVQLTETAINKYYVSTSDSLTVQINDVQKPVLFAIYPNTLPEFQPNIILTVTGFGFNTNSIIVWNNINLITNYISPQELKGALPPYDINILGEMPVYILNP